MKTATKTRRPLARRSSRLLAPLGVRLGPLPWLALALWYFNRKKAPALSGAGSKRVRVAAGDSSTRWYPALSDGTFLDLVDELKQAGCICNGNPPVLQCVWQGVTFALVHDVEGGLRVVLMNKGAGDVEAFWKSIDNAVKPFTVRAQQGHNVVTFPSSNETKHEAPKQSAKK